MVVPLPSADEIIGRWRPLYRDEAWMRVVQDIEAYVRRVAGGESVALWVSLPPHGHWLRIAAHGDEGACLLPGEEPLVLLRTREEPLRCPPAPSSDAFRRVMQAQGIGTCWLLPLSLEAATPLGRQFVGVLAVGWGEGRTDPPVPTDPAWTSVLAYLLAQRVQDTYIEAVMEWIAAQPPPASGSEWQPLLAALMSWFGGAHWALSAVERTGGRTTRWELVTESGTHPGIGAGWVDHANQHGEDIWHAPGVHSVFQRRIDFAGDFATQPGQTAALRTWQGRLMDLGIRSIMALPLGENTDGRNGVLVIYWHAPYGWLEVSASARPWEALRRLMAGWWREMSMARHLVRDPLTGVLNRRGVLQVWQQEAEAGALLGILDCDGFHRVNNTWGHLVGDEVLRGLARVLLDEVQGRGGWCGRWGGDEFVVGLPAGTDWALFGETLQRRLDAEGRERGWPERVTLSGGAVGWRGFRPSLDVAVARADRALYEAKALGGMCFLTDELLSGAG